MLATGDGRRQWSRSRRADGPLRLASALAHTVSLVEFATWATLAGVRKNGRPPSAVSDTRKILLGVERPGSAFC